MEDYTIHYGLNANNNNHLVFYDSSHILVTFMQDNTNKYNHIARIDWNSGDPTAKIGYWPDSTSALAFVAT